MYNEDIIEGDVDPMLIAEMFQNTIFDKITERERCKHVNLNVLPDGVEYCVLCGTFITIPEENNEKNKLFDFNLISKKCKHENNIKSEAGINMCADCGKEIDTFDSQSWNNHNEGGKSKRKPMKNSQKNIGNIFPVEILPAIIERVTAKFNVVIAVNENKLFRGKGRKGIIGACLFYVYQDVGEFRTLAHIKDLLGLSQKDMSNGLTQYYIAYPEDRTRYISSEKLIPWIMKLNGIEQFHYPKIMAISEYMSSSSELIERSNPQSVAASIVYLYLCLYPKYKEKYGLTKTVFANKSSLSDITISKLVTNMAIMSNITAIEWKKTINT
jgi:transcription initiation factor TFIIIB Brf1 subunit/transcription initiation factor TFIIB